MYGQVFTSGRVQDNFNWFILKYQSYNTHVILLKHIFELTEEILRFHC